MSRRRGFGECFLRRLQLGDRGPQHDGRRGFRIVVDGTDAWIEEDDGKPAYRFTRQPNALAEFASGCAFHQSPASRFRRGRLITRAAGLGRITLRDDRLIATDAAGVKTATPIGDAATWRRTAVDELGIVDPGALA